MTVTQAEKLVTNRISFYYLSDDAVEKAQNVFASLQSQGVIKQNCVFEDSVWQTTDEFSNVGLHFRFNMVSYKANYQNLFSLEYTDFIDYVKAYIISIFGKNALQSIRSFLLDLRHIIGLPPFDVYALTPEIRISLPHLVEDFLSQLPKNDDNAQLQRLIDSMDSFAENNLCEQRPNQRTLADFETYFLFDEYMDRFWNSADLKISDKLFYYPLYLWWKLTAVVPLRPREFLVSERNCLSCIDGKYHLRVRRTKLKGGWQNVSYNLENDFEVDTLDVPFYLGKAFKEYIKLTEGFAPTDLDTLFRTDSHYDRWDRAAPYTSRYLTYANMRTILRCFYQDVLQGIYGLEPVCLDDGVHLEKGQICRIHLGDTRHIALINLMHSGGTPMLAMVLAGHTNENMAAHYYSNVEKLIECKVYMYTHNLLSESRRMQIIPYTPLLPGTVQISLGDGGNCLSEKYRNHCYDDCQAVMGPDGEIGYCPGCIYYRASGISRYADADRYKRKLHDDCTGLKEAIQVIRAGKGNADIEEIGEAFLRLQASAHNYEMFCLENFAAKEAADE